MFWCRGDRWGCSCSRPWSRRAYRTPAARTLLLLSWRSRGRKMQCWPRLLAAVGSLLGSVVFYEIMRKGGEKFLAKYTARRQRTKVPRVVLALRTDHGLHPGAAAHSDFAFQGFRCLRRCDVRAALSLLPGAGRGAVPALSRAGVFRAAAWRKLHGVAERPRMALTGAGRGHRAGAVRIGAMGGRPQARACLARRIRVNPVTIELKKASPA